MSDNSNNEPKIDYLEKRVIVVDGVEHEILHTFFVPQIGWEMDYKAYIIEYKGEKRLVYSDHGRLHLIKNDVVEAMRLSGEKKKIMGDHLWLVKEILAQEDYIKDFKEALSKLGAAIEVDDAHSQYEELLELLEIKDAE